MERCKTYYNIILKINYLIWLLQLKLYYYKVLVIASIMKSFSKEKLCSNEFCVIIGCIYSESSQQWTVIFKGFLFFFFSFKLNFIQAKMGVCFQSLFLSLFMCLSTGSTTVKRNTKLLTFGPRTMLVIKLSPTLEQAASSEHILLCFPCLRSQERIVPYSLECSVDKWCRPLKSLRSLAVPFPSLLILCLFCLALYQVKFKPSPELVRKFQRE